MKIKIHGQKSNITGHIAIAEPVIEFYTVVNIYLVSQAYICRIEITMTIPDLTRLDAVLKDGIPGKKCTGIGRYGIKLSLGQGAAADKILCLLEIFQDIDGNGFGGAEFIDFRISCGLFIKRDQDIHQGLNMVSMQFTPLNNPGHHPFFRHSPHFYSILDHITGAAKTDGTTVVLYLYQSQVDFRTQATVQEQFLPAAVFTLFQGRKIQETEIHRFLKLVDKVACQQNKRDMGLHQGDRIHGIRIALRLQQGLNIFGIMILGHDSSILSYKQQGFTLPDPGTPVNGLPRFSPMVCYKFMNEKKLHTLLQELQQGDISVDDVINQLCRLPEHHTEAACLDHHRCLRTGIPEAVFAQNKTAEQLIDILTAQLNQDQVVLATRVDEQKAEIVCSALPQLHYHKTARMLSGNEDKIIPAQDEPVILLVTAGTSDLPVAEEARITLHCLGHGATFIADAGVAGIHRILRHTEKLRQARVIIVVAGMEGALPSVIAGITPAPVIGVPTSIGYGTGTGGFAALLAMLNSCSPGIAVVNIDNGFGAACMAAAICR